MDYSVYTEDGEIIRSGVCPPSVFLGIESALPPGQKIINKKACDLSEKIVNGVVVPLTQEELDLRKYNDRKDTVPSLDMSQPLEQIDQEINEYFAGKLPSIDEWKVSNSSALRKQAYPQITEYLDAQVKIASGNPALIEEGQKQLQEYTQKCLAVKETFPKE